MIYLVEYSARYAEDGCGILAAYDNREAANEHVVAVQNEERSFYDDDQQELQYHYFVSERELLHNYDTP